MENGNQPELKAENNTETILTNRNFRWRDMISIYARQETPCLQLPVFYYRMLLSCIPNIRLIKKLGGSIT